MTPQYIMHAGRILPVVALVKQNGIPHVAVMIAPDRPLLVPLSCATPAAPPHANGQRRAAVLTLVVDNTKHGGCNAI